MNNTQINRAATKKIAVALEELNEKAVFVGGAVVSLYIDDPSAEDVRPTKDIDISLEITGLGELEALRQKLTSKKFYQSAEDDVICRFRYEEIKVDVMSTKEVGWAPANEWFAPGFKQVKTVYIDQVPIKILPFPYFLATKFSAFKGRGGKDPRTSHDFEDIVYLMNYTSNMADLIKLGNAEVQNYLIQHFREILESEILQEAVIGNLYYENQMIRFAKIMSTLKNIIQ